MLLPLYCHLLGTALCGVRGLEDGWNHSGKFFTWKFLRLLFLENFNSFSRRSIGAHTCLPLFLLWVKTTNTPSTPNNLRELDIKGTSRAQERELLFITRDLTTPLMMCLSLWSLVYLCPLLISMRAGTDWILFFTNTQDLAQYWVPCNSVLTWTLESYWGSINVNDCSPVLLK